MGEMADEMIDRMIFGRNHYYERSRKRPTYQSGSGDFMWRSAEGLINMYDMTPEHRENAMEVCRRKGNSGKLKQLEQVQREMRKARPHEFSEDIPFT
jgi:DNA-binding IclR family transcriptional regulator